MRLITILIFTSLLLVVNGLLVPNGATAAITQGPLTASRADGDDINTSVAPALLAISGANGNNANQSGGLINVGDAAFAAANPADGSGTSGEGWTFNWANAATQTAVEATINGTYYSWVVSAPTNVMAGGDTYNDPMDPEFIMRYGANNMNEIGGALLNLTANYAVPANTATDTFTLHWIQALTGASYGAATPTSLDNPFAGGMAPFYDAGGAAGTVAGNPNAWYLDIPNAFENEYEGTPVTTRTFQLTLALDDQTTDKNGIVQNSVTLLGGYQWGYTYTAADTPEPVSFVSWMALSGIGLLVHRRSRKSP